MMVHVVLNVKFPKLRWIVYSAGLQFIVSRRAIEDTAANFR